MGGNKAVRKYIFHVTGVKLAIGYAVCFRIDAGIFHGLRNIFNTNDFTGLRAHKLSYCASPCVEVINNLRAVKACKLTGFAIKLKGLPGVCLIKRLGTYAETQVLHLFIYRRFSAEKYAFLVRNAVITLCINDIIQ